jgi:hypothetical protein
MALAIAVDDALTVYVQQDRICIEFYAISKMTPNLRRPSYFHAQEGVMRQRRGRE